MLLSFTLRLRNSSSIWFWVKIIWSKFVQINWRTTYQKFKRYISNFLVKSRWLMSKNNLQQLNRFPLLQYYVTQLLGMWCSKLVEVSYWIFKFKIIDLFPGWAHSLGLDKDQLTLPISKLNLLLLQPMHSKRGRTLL